MMLFWIRFPVPELFHLKRHGGERQAWGNDLSLYAWVLTREKLEAPSTLQTALNEAHDILRHIEQEAASVDITSELASEVTGRRLVTDTIHTDQIPDDRRSRRRTQTTKLDRILVMYKR